jgi:hypothetical protein
MEWVRRTDLCVSFHFHDLHAFDNCGARIVDAIHHRLRGELASHAVQDMQRLENAFNWIIVRSYQDERLQLCVSLSYAPEFYFAI